MISELNCSLGEGGGSIVRIAVALAAATNTPLKLYNIRSKRSNPGLRPQHIEAINAISQISGIKITGCEVGSSSLLINKGSNIKDEANVKINTAGSVGLVAQAVMYYSFPFQRDIVLNINGGATHGKWAPSIEFIKNITHKLLKFTGKSIKTAVDRYGFYPKGGAKAEIIYMKHENLKTLELIEKGELKEIEIFSTCSNFLKKRDVAQRQIDSFTNTISSDYPVKTNIKYVNSSSPGTGLTVISKYSSGTQKGCFVTGERNLSSENVGKKCASMWLEQQKGTGAIDSFAADQLLLPLALIEGKSSITVDSITKHTKTNIDLIQKFTKAKINVEKINNCYLVKINNS